MSDEQFRDFEHAGWQRAAAAYAETFELATAAFAPRLLDAAGVHRGGKVLDVACGPGAVTNLAATRGAQATGMDFSANMIAEAKRRFPALAFQEGDAEALPFQDATFDAVVISFGMHHFPFPARAVAEAHRVLRGRGRFAFATWAPPERHVLHKLLVDALREAGDSAPSFPVAPGGAVNDIPNCKRLMRDAGFLAESVTAEIIFEYITLRSAAELVEFIQSGTVRMSSMLRSQPADRMPAIVAAIEKRILTYRHDGGFRIPFAAILATGAKA